MPSRSIEENKTALANKAVLYLSSKEKEKTGKDEQDKLKPEILSLLDAVPHEKNGLHKEITLPLPDGKMQVFIRNQVAEKVKTVDNLIDLIKEKLGDKAGKFIYTTEVLHTNALENMLAEGLIDAADIQEWTSTLHQTSLIVKMSKIKK